MPLRWNKNRLTAKLRIDYPVIQGQPRRTVITNKEKRD
jgi:hypothetical protein